MDGRALTIYEKAYPGSELNTDKAHREFIEELSYCLPEGCQPIIVTDAGFKSPWFEAIEKKNWFWLGRVLVKSNRTLFLESFRTLLATDLGLQNAVYLDCNISRSSSHLASYVPWSAEEL